MRDEILTGLELAASENHIGQLLIQSVNGDPCLQVNKLRHKALQIIKLVVGHEICSALNIRVRIEEFEEALGALFTLYEF